LAPCPSSVGRHTYGTPWLLPTALSSVVYAATLWSSLDHALSRVGIVFNDTSDHHHFQ